MLVLLEIQWEGQIDLSLPQKKLRSKSPALLGLKFSLVIAICSHTVIKSFRKNLIFCVTLPVSKLSFLETRVFQKPMSNIVKTLGAAYIF